MQVGTLNRDHCSLAMRSRCMGSFGDGQCQLAKPLSFAFALHDSRGANYKRSLWSPIDAPGDSTMKTTAMINGCFW